MRSDRKISEPALKLCLLGRRSFGKEGSAKKLSLRNRDAICLAAIALNGKRGIHRETLANICWPAASRTRAAQSLSMSLLEIRRALKLAGDDVIIEHIKELSLNPSIQVDVLETMDVEDTADPVIFLSAAKQILEEFLRGINDGPSEVLTWIAIERQRLSNVATQHMQTAALKFVKLDRFREVVDVAHLLAREMPECEDQQIEICHALMAKNRLSETRDIIQNFAKEMQETLAAELDGDLADLLEDVDAAIRTRTERTVIAISPRLAVLPFVSASNSPKEKAISKGLATEIVYDLSSNPNLEVLSQSMVEKLARRDDVSGYLKSKYAVDLAIEGRLSHSPNGRFLYLSATDLSSNTIVWKVRVELQECGLEQLSEVANRLGKALSKRLSELRETLRPTAMRFDTLAVHASVRSHYDAFAIEHLEGSYLALRDALKPDPNHAPSWLLLAYLCEGLEVRRIHPAGTDPSADRRAAIKRALALDPFDGRIQIEVGDMHYKAGHIGRADECYHKADAMTRGANELLCIKPKYMVGALGDHEGARATLTRARRLYPKDDAWLSSNAIRTLTLLGDYEDALVEARKAPPATLHLACQSVAALRTGHVTEARDARDALLAATGGKGVLETFRSDHFRPYARDESILPRITADATAVDKL